MEDVLSRLYFVLFQRAIFSKDKTNRFLFSLFNPTSKILFFICSDLHYCMCTRQMNWISLAQHFFPILNISFCIVLLLIPSVSTSCCDFLLNSSFWRQTFCFFLVISPSQSKPCVCILLLIEVSVAITTYLPFNRLIGCNWLIFTCRKLWNQI